MAAAGEAAIEMEDMVHSRQLEGILRKRLHKDYGRFLEALAMPPSRCGLAYTMAIFNDPSFSVGWPTS